LLLRQGVTTLKLRRKPKTAEYADEDDVFIPPRQPWRLTRKARETLIFCLIAFLIAGLVWGVYRWTDASRYTPPIYTGGTTLKP
jgi:hypothetical protein